MRVRSLVVAIVLALGATAQAGGPEDSWLPARPGWKWTYDVQKVSKVAGFVKAKKLGSATCVCTGTEKVGDKECAVLAWEGADDAKVWVFSNEDSVTVVKATHGSLLVVPVNAKEKNVKVVVQSEKGPITVESRTLAGEEEVKVPAGTFKCLKVEAECTTAGGVKVKRTVWYAKGTGVVKVAKETEVGAVTADREIVLTAVEKK